MLDLMNKLTQLSEAVKDTGKGKIHTAEPGGYGRKDDEDDEGKKVKADAPKKGRGRPKKDADASGEVKKYDFSAFGATGKDVKLKPWDKSKTKKHSLKEWVTEVENNYVAEAGLTATQTMVPGMQVGNKGAQPTIIDIKNNPALKAALDKAAQQKQITTVGIPQAGGAAGAQTSPPAGAMGAANQPVVTQEAGFGDVARKVGSVAKKVGGKVLDTLGHGSDEDLIRQLQKRAGMPQTGKLPMATSNKEVDEASYSPKAARAGKDIGKPGKQFAKIAKSAAERYGSEERGKKVAGAVLAKLRNKTNEADIPSTSSQDTAGAGLGAGRSQTTLEGKKPDFLDLDKDKNKKESMAKAAQDAKKKKKKVDESMDNKLKAAHHRGKAHALAKESYNCKYDDMEESRQYHEGYKEGLDECYGQVPIRGTVVGEMDIPSTVPGMADQAMEAEMDEGNAFTAALARTPQGGKFSVGGKTFTDRTGYDAKVDETMFESWNNELSSLLEEYDTIQEGMTVSISKGQQGQPDSVSVTAQDQEADQLLQAIKQAGLGLFGGDEVGQVGQSSPMSLQPTDGGPEGQGDIGVVDDHDGMMALIKKVTGGAGVPDTVTIGGDEDQDYEDEESHDHDESEECETCGSADCECDAEEGEEQQVDEVESEDQMAYEVAEDNAPDSGAEDTDAEVADTAQANQSAAEYDEAEETDEEAEKLDEWANEAGQRGTDAQFETDIAFMTKVIAGGLNKEKSTGQTTIPVIAGQKDRMGYSINESIGDWKKLAGLK